MSPATLTEERKPQIIDPERQARKNVSKPAHFVIKVDFKDIAGTHRNSFLIVPLEALAKHMPRILAEFSRLRVIFVISKDCTRVDALIDTIVQTNASKILRKLVFTDKFKDIDRILHAWCDSVQDSTIAEAWVDQDSLVIKTCALERMMIAFNALPQLASIPKEHRSDFEIDQFGRYLFWDKQDIHLNVDAVRCMLDEDFRRKRDIELITHNKKYGTAVTMLREQHGLSQQDIARTTGITDRQLRRIEREGHSLSAQMVNRLAKAHGVSANEYLNALANILQTLSSKPQLRRSKN